MSFLGSSILNTFQFIQRGGGNQGNPGPTGPTGSTGNTGPVGPTGNTGIGIVNITKLSSDGIRVELTDGSTIDVTGISGAAPSSTDVGSLSYSVTSTVPPASGDILLIKEVAGRKSTFKVFQGDGITFELTSNNIVISAPTILGAGSLQNNNVLGVSGTTGIIFFNNDTPSQPAFIYNQVLSGITVYDFADTTIGPFIQSLTDNINTYSGTVNLSNTDVVINQFYYDNATSSWKNKNTIKLSAADLSNNNYSVTYEDTVFSGATAVYPFIEDIGSCCMCNIFSTNGDRSSTTTGTTYSDNMCIDYISKSACNSIGGVFSVNSCKIRTLQLNEKECVSTGAVPESGICCTCGTNNSSGGNEGTCVSGTVLPKDKCIALFGDAAWIKDTTCGSDPCLSPCSGKANQKKKLIQTSDKGYASRFSCAITEDGNVVCWGPLIQPKEITVRDAEGRSEYDYFAKQIAIGENQVVILAEKIIYEDGKPKIDKFGEYETDKNETKASSVSFTKSIVENKLESNTNIFRAAFGHFSPFEYFKSFKTGGFYSYSGPFDTINQFYFPTLPPAQRSPIFIGLNTNQKLFASGNVIGPNDYYVLQNGVDSLVPLPEGDFKDVVGGVQHVAAIRAYDGSVLCWGSNEFGQSTPPNNAREFDQVAVGRFHTVGLRRNGDIVCWGAGLTGLGGINANDDIWPHYGQSKVPEELMGKQILQIGAGYYYSAALLSDGTVKVWGAYRGLTYPPLFKRASDFDNVYKKLRDDINKELVPQPAGLTAIKEIVCAPYSIVGLRENGTLVAWGDDSGWWGGFDVGLTGYGHPTTSKNFYKQLKRFESNINPKFEQIAADDTSIYGLQNIYSCPGVTFVDSLRVKPSAVPPDIGVDVPPGTRDPTKTKILLFYSKDLAYPPTGSSSRCIRCIETLESDYGYIASDLNAEDRYTGLTYPWSINDTTHSPTPYSEHFINNLSGWGLSLIENIDNFKCYDDVNQQKMWDFIQTKDSTQQIIFDLFNIDEQTPNGLQYLEPCTYECNYKAYRPIVSRNEIGSCLNCKYITDCQSEDFIYDNLDLKEPDQYGQQQGHLVYDIGENCYNTHDKTYIWERNLDQNKLYSGKLPKIFYDFDGRTLGACLDLNGDGIRNNDEDDICDGEELVIKEQYIWEMDAQKTSPDNPYWRLTPPVHNIKCLNRGEEDQFWVDGDVAFDLDYYGFGNICNKSRSQILSSRYIYGRIKQEIFLLSNSGNGVYYVMKPDKVYVDGKKILNYKILNPQKVGYDNEPSSYFSAAVGNRTELLLIKDVNQSYYGSWSNSELLTDDVNSLNNCDSNIIDYFDRDFSFNNNCGVHPEQIGLLYEPYTERKVVGAAFGFGHGLYVLAGVSCIRGETLGDCETGYVVNTRNATGLTALNGRFRSKWNNPISLEKDETNFYQQSSRFWYGVTAPVQITGITYKIRDTAPPGTNEDKVLKNYNASCGFYHSCIVINQEARLQIGITLAGTDPTTGKTLTTEVWKYYKPGDVICWGVGEDPARENTFNYQQAYIESLTDTLGVTAEQVSCGKFHTAILLKDKRLKIFGAGSTNSTTGFNFKQSIIPEFYKNSVFNSVSCGGYHTIAEITSSSGTLVIGWGRGSGYLDNLSLDKSYSWKNVPGKIIRMVSGDSHNIFLTDDGSVFCSGSNDTNQCEICENPTYNRKKYIWVDAKEDITVAIDAENALYVFGNIKNNLEAVPEDVKNPQNNRRIISVASGENHNLALLGFKDDPTNYGEIRGWGYDPQLSRPNLIPYPHYASGSSSNTTAMVYSTQRKPLKLIGDGSYYPYSLEKSYERGLIGLTGNSKYSIKEIIDNFGGESGVTAKDYFDFIRKEKLKDPRNTSFSVSSISAGGLRSFAIRSLNDVKYAKYDNGLYSYIIAWGRNYGNMPVELNSIFTIPEFIKTRSDLLVKRYIPVEIKNSNLFVGVRIAETVIKVDSENPPEVLFDKICVYYDDDTKLALENMGETVGTPSPNPYYGDLKFLTYERDGKEYSKFKNYSIGAFHIIAIIDSTDELDGTIVTWGLKKSKENKGQFEIPQENGVLLKFKDVSAGKYHNIGILEDDTVYCWGSGKELSYDTGVNVVDLGQSIVPLDSSGNPIKAKAISAGDYHSLAIQLIDNTLFAWGAGSEAYSAFVGQPHYKQSIVPKDEFGLPIKVVKISGGDFHSLAITEDFRIKAWGNNESNQTADIFEDKEKFSNVVCGSGYSLALTKDGGVVGWGYGSYESPDISFSGGINRLFGSELQSAAPPKETVDIATSSEDPWINNRIGENNLLLYTYSRGDREKSTQWGDNSYKQLMVPPPITISSVPEDDVDSPLWYPFNNRYGDSEGTYLLQLQGGNYYSSITGYGSYYFSGYSVPNFNSDSPWRESFITGSGLNAGLKWFNDTSFDIEKREMWPVSKIDGITGISIPIFADLFTNYYYGNRLNNPFKSNLSEYIERIDGVIGREDLSWLKYNSGYFGIVLEDFWLLSKDSTGASTYSAIYRSDIPAAMTRLHTDDVGKGGQSNYVDGITSSFQLIDKGTSLAQQFGIHWGLKPFETTLTVGEYDWKEAYAFALGWNPFTNQPVSYFDLHHNLWNTKTELKYQLSTDGCTDCEFIKDIKAGYTPLESLSGRYGLRVDTKNLNGSNLHNSFFGQTKVCGKLDLNDPLIHDYVLKIEIEDRDGGIKSFYLIDTALLFGNKYYADTYYFFPFHNHGLLDDYEYKNEEDPRIITTIERLKQIFINGKFEIIRYNNKQKASTDDDAICNRPAYFGKTQTRWIDTELTPEPKNWKVFDEQRWLYVPIKDETIDNLYLCFKVNGVCSFGDNSKGQFGITSDGAPPITNWVPKPWIPSFLMNDSLTYYYSFIKSGYYHSILNTLTNNSGNITLYTFKDPIIEYKFIGDLNFEGSRDDWLAEINGGEGITAEIRKTFFPITGSTLSPSYWYTTTPKPIFRERYIVQVPCGREGTDDKPTFVTYPDVSNGFNDDKPIQQNLDTLIDINPEKMHAGLDHINLIRNTPDRGIIGYGINKYGLSIQKYPSLEYGDTRLEFNQMQYVDLKKGANHNIVTYSHNYENPDKKQPIIVDATFNSASKEYQFVVKDLNQNVIDTYSSGELIDGDGTEEDVKFNTVVEQVSWLSIPQNSTITEQWRYYDGVLANRTGRNNVLIWGSNESGQIYNDETLRLLKGQTVTTIQSTGSYNQIYEVNPFKYYPLSETSKFAAGLSHSVFLLEHDRGGVYPEPSRICGRVSQGATYANPYMSLIVTGDTTKSQNNIPELLKPNIAGVTVFEMNVGSKIKNITISPNDEYIAYTKEGSKFIEIISGIHALRGNLSGNTIVTEIKGVQLQNESINSIKFTIDNALLVGLESGRLLIYEDLVFSDDFMGFTLSAPLEVFPDDGNGELLRWRPLTENTSYPPSLSDSKFLSIIGSKHSKDPYNENNPKLNIFITKTDDTILEFRLDNNRFVTDGPPIDTIYVSSTKFPQVRYIKSIRLEVQKPPYNKDNYTFTSPITCIATTTHDADEYIAVGLANGTVAYRKYEDGYWSYLKAPTENSKVTSIAWGNDIHVDIGKEEKLFLVVGHINGMVYGWKPLEDRQLYWSSEYGGLGKQIGKELQNWCKTGVGITYCYAGLDCDDDKQYGECSCFTSGEITSIDTFGFNFNEGLKSGELSNWKGILFTSKNFDDAGEPINPNKNGICNPGSFALNSVDADNYIKEQDPSDSNTDTKYGGNKYFYGITGALPLMYPALETLGEKYLDLIRTKRPALIGRFSFMYDDKQQGTITPLRSYHNTTHLEYDNRIRQLGFTFDNANNGFTGGELLFVKIGKTSDKIFTIGTDNDIRIESNFSTKSFQRSSVAGQGTFEYYYPDAFLEPESNICVGDKNPDESPNKNQKITAVDLFSDETHLIIGTTSGIIRIWNTERKSLLSWFGIEIDTIECGNNHTCIQYQSNPNGPVGKGYICFGNNEFGQCNVPKQLGLQTYYQWYYPNNIFSPYNKRIAVGGNNTCLTETPQYCWGDNSYNQVTEINQEINKTPYGIEMEYGYFDIGQGSIVRIGLLTDQSGCGDTEFFAGSVYAYGKDSNIINEKYSLGSWYFIKNPFGQLLARYGDFCGYTGPRYLEAYDMDGKKINCYSEKTLYDDTSETGQNYPQYFPDSVLVRYDLLNGFNSVYPWGDNTYGQSKWPLEKSFIGYTGLNKITYYDGYHPQKIRSAPDSPRTPNCRCWRNVGYVMDVQDEETDMGIYDQRIGHGFPSSEVKQNSELGADIYVGGYHNIIDFTDAYSGTNLIPIKYPLVRQNIIGWGRNDYRQAEIENVPPSSSSLYIEPNGGGKILGSKNATIFTTIDRFYGTGYTLARQLQNTPYFIDFGIGNGYGFYSHESGYLLEKISSNTIMNYYIRRNQFVYDEFYPFNPVGLNGRMRTFRTTKKIRAGKDYALFLSNEGRIITPVYYFPWNLPRHMTTVTLGDFNVNSPPVNFVMKPLKDIQIGNFHVIGLDNDNQIKIWGVDPDLQFSKQYYQTVIPPSLVFSKAVRQIYAGKYHNIALVENFDGTKYSRRVVAFGEPGNALD